VRDRAVVSAMTDPDDDLELARTLFVAATARIEEAHEACVNGQCASSVDEAVRISVEVCDTAEAASKLLRAVGALRPVGSD